MALVFYLPDKWETWECANILYSHVLFCLQGHTITIINTKVVPIVNIRILGRICLLSEANSSNDYWKSVLIFSVCRQSGMSQTPTQEIESSLSHGHRAKVWWHGGGAGCHSQFSRTHLLGNQIAGHTRKGKSPLLRNLRDLESRLH